MRFLLQQLRKNNKGASAIEFAFTLPIFITLMFATVEFGLILHVTSLLQNATYEGARFAITGDNYAELQSGNDETLTRKEFIEETIKKGLSIWLRDESQITINTKSVATVEDFGLSGYAFDSYDGYGSGDEIVLYKVSYQWKMMTPFMGNFIGDDEGYYPITAVVVSKNEGF